MNKRKPNLTNLKPLLKQAAEKLEALEFGSALALYQQALALAPTNAGATMGLVLVYNRLGQPREALLRLEPLWKAAQKVPGDEGRAFQASVLAQIGWAREQLGNTTLALAAFEQAHERVPTQELQERIAKLKPKLVPTLDPVQALLAQARAGLRSGALKPAEQWLTQALRMNPDHVDCLQEMAALYRRQGAVAQALPLLQRAIILNPDRADLFNDLGIVFQELGNITKAISFHKRALKIDPAFVFAMINLGVAYKRQGKFDLAIQTYQEALQHAPHLAEAHNNLGNLLRQQGQLEVARQHLLKALQIKPGYVDAIANLKVVEAELAAQTPPKPKAARSTAAKTLVVESAVAKKAPVVKKTLATKKALAVQKVPGAKAAPVPAEPKQARARAATANK